MTYIRENFSLNPYYKSKTNYCSDEDMDKIVPIKENKDKMKAEGNQFTYFLNGEQIKDFDTFEKKLKSLDVTIEVTNFRIDARTK